MPIQTVPRKIYRLRDGSKGTEYEALSESIAWWQALQRQAEEKIELLRRRLDVAEGNPG